MRKKTLFLEFLCLFISYQFQGVGSFVFGAEEREGFYKQLHSTETVLTVPAEKEFVILQLLCKDPDERWSLKIDDNVIFDNNIFGYKGIISSNGNAVVANFDITFPDRCVTVEGGKSLFFETDSAAYLTIIGYFYDVGNCPKSDLSGDCIVNLVDFAILASEWMENT